MNCSRRSPYHSDIFGKPLKRSVQEELDAEWQEEPIGESANGELLWDESQYDSPFKTNMDRFRLGVTVDQTLLAVIDHDRLPWDTQTAISKIVGNGPLGWGQYMAELAEADWKAIGVMVAKVCGTTIEPEEIVGFRLTETTNRSSGYPVWGLYFYRTH